MLEQEDAGMTPQSGQVTLETGAYNLFVREHGGGTLSKSNVMILMLAIHIVQIRWCLMMFGDVACSMHVRSPFFWHLIPPKVPVSLVHEKVVEAFGTEISRVECYSATSHWCVLYIMLLCLSLFVVIWPSHNDLHIPCEMCLQKRRHFPLLSTCAGASGTSRRGHETAPKGQRNLHKIRISKPIVWTQLFESSHIEDCEGLFEIYHAVIIPGKFRRAVSVPFNSLTQGFVMFCPSDVRSHTRKDWCRPRAKSLCHHVPNHLPPIGHVLPFCIGWKDSSGRTDHRSRSATCGLTGQAISFFRYFAELRSYQFNSVCVSSHRWILKSARLCAVLQMSEQSSFGSLLSFSMFSMMACAFHIPFAGVSCGSSTAADRWCDSWGASSWL